jgi:hypothetical protein
VLLWAFLAASPAGACLNGPPGHVHLFAAGASAAPALEMGLCVGGPGETPPDDAASPPIKQSEAKVDTGTIKSLELIGYRLDAAADRFFDKDRKPLTVSRWEHLWGPADLSRESVPTTLWMGYQTAGYRLDEATCRLVHPSSGPVRRADLMVWREYDRRGQSHLALETLKAELAGLPPGTPIPPAVIQKLRDMEGAQTRLPERVRALLFSGAPTVGAMKGALDRAYLDSTRFFDGLRDRESFAVSARVLGSPGSRPPVVRAPVSSREAALGATISAELQAAYEGTDAGRELLAHFRGPDGRATLPPVLVLKLTQRPDDPNSPGAIYDPSGRQVVLNHWELARIALAQAPEKDRAALAKDFADADKLGRWLAANPEARRRAMERVDFLLLHEFVHYRQGDQSKLSIETLRQNAPGNNPLSFEHEAHRQECRYFLERVSRDPSLISRGYGGNRQQYCPSLLDDPAILEGYVTDLYRKTFAGSAELSDVPKLQAARREAARSLLLEGIRSLSPNWVNQALKLVGFSHGDAAIAEEARRSAEVRADLVAKLDPLRERWVREVPAALARSGEPYTALYFLQKSGWRGREDDARRAVREAALSLSRREPRTTLESRLAAHAILAQIAPGLGVAREDALTRAYEDDAREWIVRLRQRAKNAPPAEAAALQEQIRDWMSVLPPERPRRKEKGK